MSQRSQSVFMAVAVIVAAVGGGVVSSALAHRSKPAAPADPENEDKPSDRASPVAPSRGTGRDLAMLRKVGELESRVEELENVEGPRNAEQNEAEEPFPGEATPEAYYARHEDHLEAHRSEPLDPSWGPNTGYSFQEDMDRLGEEVGFRVGKVECRNETCSAETSWDRFSDAQENYVRLLTAPFRANCSRSIVFPEKEGAEPVSGTLLLDCSDWKAQGSKALEIASPEG